LNKHVDTAAVRLLMLEDSAIDAELSTLHLRKSSLDFEVTVARGRRYISPAVAELLADGVAGESERAPHELLSERELQVFLRLARGETIGAMAESMFLSVKTVSTYRTRVLEKLKLTSNSDLTYYALKNGLIQ